MRGPLLAVAGALVCWLLLASPPDAEQVVDPLAALAVAAARSPRSGGLESPPPAPGVAFAAAPVLTLRFEERVRRPREQVVHGITRALGGRSPSHPPGRRRGE